MKTIDIHTHGIGGYDTRTTDEDHILRIAELHGARGVSEIILTIYPATIKVMRQNMLTIMKAMGRQKKGDKSQSRDVRRQIAEDGREITEEDLMTVPARITGVHLEGPFLNPLKSGALNAMTFVDPSELRLKQLIEGFEDIIRIITIAPELENADRTIKKIADLGIVASMGHSDATYTEAEAGFNAGAKGITHIFNAMRGFHHREPGIAGFGLLNEEVYLEVIADAYHLDIKTLELIFRLKNPDRIIIVSDSVKETNAHPPREPLPEWIKGPGITDFNSTLLGGASPITEVAQDLIRSGFEEAIINKCISENPEVYLNDKTI